MNRSFFERLPLPTFSGKLVEYPTFKSQFSTLMENSGYPEVLLLEHLKKAIPRESHHLVEASRTLEAAWSRLDLKYADKISTTVIVHEALLNLELKGK